MTYLQLVAEAMVKLGDNDLQGAEASYLAAIALAEQIDPQGPRHAETLNYLAQFLRSQDRMSEAAQASQQAQGMLANLPEFSFEEDP